MPAIALGLRPPTHGAALLPPPPRWRGWADVAALAAHLADRTVVSCGRCAGARPPRTPSAPSASTSRSAAPSTWRSAAAILAALRAVLGFRSARVIVVVSRLRAEKGIDVLIRALPGLSDLTAVHVVVVGDGPEEVALRRLAAGAPVPVHFVGHRGDAAAWLALATVVAIPSRRESFGRVTLEAMAAGRPLVASCAGGIVDAVTDGETGLLVAPDDPPALAAALRAVLESDALAQRLGAAGRARYLARHTIDHMAAAWQQAWAGACSGGRRDR